MDHNPIETPSLSTPIFFQLQEEERYRLAHALMDGPGQILANTLVELEHCLPMIKVNPAAASTGIASLRDEIRAGLAQLKALVAELQPPLLVEMGLGPSLKQYVDEFGIRNSIHTACYGCELVRERLPLTMETAIFRIVQEALSNILAHSRAKNVIVRIERVDSQVRLDVVDDGRGFSPHETAGASRRQLGLVGMYDRAKLIGGQLQIYSEVRKGTRVVLSVPYHLHDEDLDSPGGRNENLGQGQVGRKKSKPTASGENGK